MTPALLPEGFRDRLPPEAEALSELLRRVIDTVSAHGYERVQPPIAEYEAGLSHWLGKPVGAALLRSADPVSGAGVALRPDMTGQVARIAATRLKDAPRPLRLAYAGPVIRGRGTDLDPARERTQAGAELVGTDSVAAVAEVIAMAVEALEACGVAQVSVDLALPELVERLAAGPWPVPDWHAVAMALDRKDRGALPGLAAERYTSLLDASGAAGRALDLLEALALPPPFSGLLGRVRALVEALPEIPLTLDPTERHGFEYQSWIGFSLFARGFPGELGRGGSYMVRGLAGHREPATGFSLYLDPLAEAGLGSKGRKRLFLPFGTPRETGRALRAAGWQTVGGLEPDEDPRGLAVWSDGRG
jgi:ATP phosphoribosyltransferase regulatory subunit